MAQKSSRSKEQSQGQMTQDQLYIISLPNAVSGWSEYQF